MLAPPPHIRLAALGQDLAILDLAADRYSALPGALMRGPDTSSRPVASLGFIDETAANLLQAGGILVERDETASPIVRTSRALERRVATRVQLRDVVALAHALATTGWRLALGRHCRTFSATRLEACDPTELQAVAAALDRLAALRLVVPTPLRCLPACLVAAVFLRDLGLDAEIVFGVRAHPFLAHCWLERGGVVLDDTLDRVHAYTPIAVGRP